MSEHQCPTGKHPEPDHRCYRGHPGEQRCPCEGCRTANTAEQSRYRADLKAKAEEAA